MTFLVVEYTIHGSGIFALRHLQMYVCVQQTLPSMCIYTFDLTNVISTPQDTNAKTREDHLDLHPTAGWEQAGRPKISETASKSKDKRCTGG